MSEDRTQPPSKRRRQLARDQGQAVHSPELTAAAGWLVALTLLGFWGSDLARGLVGLVREPLAGTPMLSAGPIDIVARIRWQAMAVAAPLMVIVTGFSAGAVAAHQLQVRGLWATPLIAPDPARLWNFGREGSAAAGFERMSWAVVKGVVLAAVSLWAVRAEWDAIARLSAVETSALAGAAGELVYQPALVVGAVMLVLGMADYGLRYMRFEAMLRTTPQEQREDHRVMEGDLSLRSQRRRLALAWRGDAPELLAGASLVVRGHDGLTVVLAGGPPPRRVTVRNAAQGNTGLQLERSIASARLPEVKAPGLALRLAKQAGLGSRGPFEITADLLTELAAIWPSK
jgi:flagellar biosynthesis protein FlhB